MVMEIAGQKIVYRDLNDLRAKLGDLLQTLRKEREVHDQETERIKKQEKSILRFLGHGRSVSAVAAENEPSHD